MKSKLVLAALAAALVTAVTASAGGQPTLRTFGSGHVFVSGDECATFNGSGEYGGCYRNKTSRAKLANVTLSFTSGADVGGGAPRFSVPIDENADRITDAYAFMDVNGCGSNSVSTTNGSCQVFYKAETHANWAAFAAAHPTWTIASKVQNGTKPNGNPIYAKDMPFIIADVAGDYLVTDVVLNY